MTKYITLEDARRNDSTVNQLLGYAGIDTLVFALANEKAALLKRVAEMELLVPRKMRFPDGSVRIYRAPDHLLPDPPPLNAELLK